MKKYFLFIICTALLNSSCAPDKKTIALTDDSSTTPSDVASPSDSALFISLSTKWEGGTDSELMGTCSIPGNAAAGTTKICTFTVPEAQLYRSSAIFSVGSTATNSCSIVTFRPYYYQRSNDPAYTPKGAKTPVVCDENDPTYDQTKAKPCYGGAGPDIVEDFPKYKGKYFLKAVTPTAQFTLKSENETRWYGGDRVNYRVTNDLSDPSTSSSVAPKERVGGEFYDYVVTCSDIWGENKYTITVIVEDEDLDEDSSNPAYDQYTDWDN